MHFGIACLGYYLAGRLGLLLAIPPGFASAIWPASGVALSLLLLFKRTPVLLGTGLGSLLINFGIATQNFSAITLAALIPSSCIALGAVAQTLAGYALWHYLLPRNTLLDTPQPIGRFLLVVAPLGCVVAASVGAGTLYGLGIVPLGNLSFTWLTWWVGDTLGIVLFTPLILYLNHQDQTTPLRRKLHIAAPIVIIFCGVLTLFYISTQTRKNAIHNEIATDAQQAFSNIKDRLTLAENKLHTYAALYKSGHTLNRQDFATIAQVIMNNEPSLQAIGWAEVVPHERRPAVEARIQQEGFPSFTFKELTSQNTLITASPQSIYYPVLYIYPFEENQAAFGLNLGTNPARLSALLKAQATNQAVSTAPIQLAQSLNNEKSIILYIPIYDQTYIAYQHSEAYAKEHITGFISGVFNISSLLNTLLSDATKHHYSVSITDSTTPNSPLPLITSQTATLPLYPPIQFTYLFGERLLSMGFYANDNFKYSSKDWTSWTILTVGFLLAAMLQALLLFMTGATERIRNEVKIQTQAYLAAKQAAEEAKHSAENAKQFAEEANLAKTQFLANMSHEFRTPLNAIIGFTNLCLKTSLNEKQLNFLQKVKLSSESLLGLVNHTLDYSKIESGKIEIENISFKLENIIEKIEAIFSLQAKGKNLDFILDNPPLFPPALMGDPLRIEQILLNFCSNAIKFCERGSITLRTRIDYTSAYTLDVTIAVIDTGIGIPENKQKAVFNAFTQADSTMSRRYGGTGLGLTIAKQLAELMGGSIRLTSQPGYGSTFALALTLQQPQLDVNQPRVAQHPPTRRN